MKPQTYQHVSSTGVSHLLLDLPCFLKTTVVLHELHKWSAHIPVHDLCSPAIMGSWTTGGDKPFIVLLAHEVDTSLPLLVFTPNGSTHGGRDLHGTYLESLSIISFLAKL